MKHVLVARFVRCSCCGYHVDYFRLWDGIYTACGDCAWEASAAS